MSNKDNNSSRPPMHRGPMGRGPMGGHAGMMPGEKPKDFKGTLRKSFRFLRPHTAKLILIMVMAASSTVFMVVGPKIMGQATTLIADSVINNSAIDFSAIGRIVLSLLALYSVSAFFSYFQQYLMAGVAQRTVYDMRKAVDAKLKRLPLKYYDSKTHGEILSRVTNDIDTVSSTLQQVITQLITAAVTLVGVLYMMLSISWVMTLITIATVPLSAVFTMFITRRSRKYFSNQQRILGELSGHVEEMYTGHSIVKAYNREEMAKEKMTALNKELYENSRKAQFISGTMMPVMQFLGNVGYVLICVAGGLFAARRMIDIGDIQAFIQYSREFTRPIVQTSQIANILQSTIAAAERVFEVLEEEEEIADASDSIDLSQTLAAQGLTVNGNVDFSHVRFGYSEDKLLIKDLSFYADPGQTVAIVGPTGAGKTTLVNLLMRFYEISGGEISVEGHPINTLKRSSLRRLFGMVLQDTWLFKGTIRDNIAYGKEDAPFEDIVRAAELARADHFIRTLADGYDTVINEEASNISQGQKQLITIARAILSDPRMLILDEATSSVDTRTELLIQKGMSNLMKGRTSFVIAHRLSTIKDADLILVMNNGDILEKGTHESLLRKQGFYAELYNSQFSSDSMRDIRSTLS